MTISVSPFHAISHRHILFILYSYVLCITFGCQLISIHRKKALTYIIKKRISLPPGGLATLCLKSVQIINIKQHKFCFFKWVNIQLHFV